MGREPLAEVDELFEQGLLPDHRKSEGVNDLHGLGWSTHETALFSGRKLRCPLAEPDELLEQRCHRFAIIHARFNYRSADGKLRLTIGFHQPKQIDEVLSLLAKYPAAKVETGT
jgi:hypothetical protein